MKNIRLLILAIASILCLSCMKDGDMLIGTLEDWDTPISSADDNIVLSKETSSSLVLTLFWDGTGNITLNNPDAQIPAGTVVNTVQFSSDKDFTSAYEQAIEANAYALQLTGAELNRILTELGYEGGIEAPLYIRMSTALGANMETKYGEAIEIQVTPFTVDMGRIQIARCTAGELTGEISYVPATADGEYEGLFVASAGWYNCFFIEGDGTIWGAYEDGNPFPLEKKSNTLSWNVWFPEPDGCYYVDINTTEAVWSAVAIPSLSLDAGNGTVEMTFSKSQKVWKGVFTTTSDNASVQVSATGDLYDKSAGTGAVAGQKGLSFAASADNTFTVSEDGTSSGITAGTAGTYTLSFYIDTMTWELTEGAPDPEPEYAEYLYAYYCWKDSGWAVELASSLWSEDKDGIYTGYMFNYKDADEKYNHFALNSTELAGEGQAEYGCGWSDRYGILPFGTSNEMCAFWINEEELGVNRLLVDMTENKWSIEHIDNFAVVGNDLGWDLTAYPFTFDESSKTASATFTAANATSVKIVLDAATSDAWEYQYGDWDSDGKLDLGEGNTIAIAEAGTYVVEVDLRDASNLTYSITKQ